MNSNLKAILVVIVFIFLNISLYIKIKQDLLHNNELLLNTIKKLNQEKSTKENKIEEIINLLKKNEIKRELDREIDLQKEEKEKEKMELEKKKTIENEANKTAIVEKVVEYKELKNKGKFAYVFYASSPGKKKKKKFVENKKLK